MDFNLGSDYGYDQIVVNPKDFREFLATTDANSLHDINTINNRERRILRKIQRFQPTCQENYDRNTMDYCRPDLFSKAGSSIEQDRMHMRKNIEDYYYSGREHRIGDCRDGKRVQLQSPLKLSKPHMLRDQFTQKPFMHAHMNKKNIGQKTGQRNLSQRNLGQKKTKDAFAGAYSYPSPNYDAFDSNDLQMIQTELESAERQNNQLIMFVFFLLVVVIIQYSKINNVMPPMVMVIPQKSETVE